MSDGVTVKYREYGNNSIAEEIEFELVKDILLKLKCSEEDEENGTVVISMADTITANTELEGKLDYRKLNILIRALSQLRNQIKGRQG